MVWLGDPDGKGAYSIVVARGKACGFGVGFVPARGALFRLQFEGLRAGPESPTEAKPTPQARTSTVHLTIKHLLPDSREQEVWSRTSAGMKPRMTHSNASTGRCNTGLSSKLPSYTICSRGVAR